MKKIIEFIKKRHEIYLLMLAIGFMLLSQSISALVNPEYASFGISWFEDIVYDHVKAFNVLVGIWIILRLVFSKAYTFLGDAMENLISKGSPKNGYDNGIESSKDEKLTIWQRSILSLSLLFLLILLYIGT